jgi:hypothetical protein
MILEQLFLAFILLICVLGALGVHLSIYCSSLLYRTKFYVQLQQFVWISYWTGACSNSGSAAARDQRRPARGAAS